MRKRIRELARGRVGYKSSSLVISVEKIDLELLEGGSLTGEFSISSDTNDVVRGNVYSSDPRMECLTPVFEGREVTIRYEFNSEGLSEGDVQKGEFSIVSDHGEYNLSFVVSVLNPRANSSMGNIKNLDDFIGLYKNYPNEAVKIFYSSYFHHVLKNTDNRVRTIYSGLRNAKKSRIGIEEFAVASGLKNRIEIEIEDTAFEFHEVEENFSQVICIKRNTWGSLFLKISTDNDIIEFSKDVITEEDFIGMTCFIPVVINKDKLHCGNNFARLTVTHLEKEFPIEFKISEDSSLFVKKSEKNQIRERFIRLKRLYFEYRMLRIGTAKWAGESIEILDELISWEDKIIYSLMKAQLFIATGRRQDAEWILDDFKRTYKYEHSIVYGYYLYVCSLFTQEKKYVNKLGEQVNDIYIRNRENPVLFFCILNLTEDYVKNKSAKFKAIEEYIGRYGSDFVLETEALAILKMEPYMAKELNGFIIKLFYRAYKNDCLDEKMAGRLIQLSAQYYGYNVLVRRLLEKCADLTGADGYTALCSYLIRNQRYEAIDFKVYKSGIEQNVRVAGIYEAYIMSMDAREIQAIPHIVLMYFRSHSRLTYTQKAVLYVNIIAAKARDPESYEEYKEQITEFAYEQLDLLRIDDSLAVIYQDVFSNSIRLREVAGHMASVMFSNRITSFDNNISKVIVIESANSEVSVTNMVKNVAYINIYTNDYVVFLEDVYGNRYVNPDIYQLERLMPSKKNIKTCIEYAKHEYGYLLYHFDNKKRSDGMTSTDIELLEILLSHDKIGAEKKNELALLYMDFLEDRGRSDIAINAVTFGLLSYDEKKKYVELLIKNNILDTAYQYISQYSIFDIDVEMQARVATYMIKSLEFQDDVELCYLCIHLFEAGCYKPDILKYLEKHATGSSKKLEKIWKVISKYDLPRENLTERLITQMLFSTEFISMAVEIFEDYAAVGDLEVIDAFLVYFSHLAFSDDAVISDRMFLYSMERLKGNDGAPLIVKLALVKHLAYRGNLNEEETKLIIKSVSDWVDRGLYFAFYKKLPVEIQERLHILDQTIVEYTTTPRRRVKIHFRHNAGEQFMEEDLHEMYYGIYVKNSVLFFGETLQYYITEELPESSEIMISNQIDNLGINGNAVVSRYDQLNELLMAYYLGEREALNKMLPEYVRKSEEVKRLFEIL